MNFRTRIDLTNRQAKQYEKTGISLSGTSTFGLPYSAMTSGPDLTMTGVTDDNALLVSTYSGNTGTTVYTWGDPRMTLDEGSLTTLTPSNSGTTQYAGPTWVGYNMFTTVDGYTGYTSYSAVTYDVKVQTMVDLGGGAYSGVTNSEFVAYSATSVDWTGSTIWVDVSGITRTDELIVTKDAVAGYVLTAQDSEGRLTYTPMSAITSGDTFLSGVTYSGNTIILDNNDGSQLTAQWTGNTSGDCLNELWVESIRGCPKVKIVGGMVRDDNATADGEGSVSLGTGTTADGEFAFSTGKYSRATGNYSMAGGGSSAISSWSGGTANGQGSLSVGINTISDGWASTSLGAENFAGGNMSFAGGGSTYAEGSASFSYGNETHASGGQSFAIGTRTLASALNSFAGGFALISGYTHASGQDSFVFMSNSGSTELGAFAESSAILGGTEHNIELGATDGAILGGANNELLSAATSSVILGGSGITGTSADTVYVPDLVIDGLTSTDPIATDANGRIVAGTSDARLKENINKIDDGLDVIKALRGVSFEYTKESNMGGGLRYGFIAQEVQEVIPDVVRARSKGNGMLNLSYTEIVPWLVEAVKELSDRPILGSISGGTESKIYTDTYGRWIAEPALATKHLIVPEFTPTSTSDERGMVGDSVWDDDYIYIKTNNGWKRTSLENF